MRIQTETRSLPTELSPEELAAESQNLAAAVERMAQQEEAIAEAKGVWTEKKKAMEGYLSHLKDEANTLAAVVDSGKADRDVACSWLYALGAGYAFLVRDDTGELVTHRKLGDAERQTDLLEVLREPTLKQLAEWTATLGLVMEPQQGLPLAAPDAEAPVYYYRDFTLAVEGEEERITGRFTEADHRPESLSGIYFHDFSGDTEGGTGLPEQDRGALPYAESEPVLRRYRQALEDLLEAKRTEALKSRREPEDEPPTQPKRARKGK